MKKWIAFALAIAACILLLWPNTSLKKQYFHNQGKIFGTYYNIRYQSTEDLHDFILTTLQQVDHSLSMFNSNSVISKVNRNDSVLLDSLFITMYNEAQGISQLSNGAFDITVAPLVHAWGFGKNIENRSQIPTPLIDSIQEFVGYQLLSLIGNQIVKSDPRTTLDASAIAKGFACDIVANALRKQGCENLLVDIGGEVVILGVNDKGHPWKVGISKPKSNGEGMDNTLQEVIASTNLCMATSGNYLQYYLVGNERRSHTIDPRSGYPVDHSLLSATVIASSCMRADALATACMVMGEKEALNMIECTPDAACYLIIAQADSLRISTSSRWKVD